MDTNALSEVLKSARQDVLQEILRESEARLHAQLQAAIAADQRAMTFLGFLLTLVVFFLTAALATTTTTTPNVAIMNLAATGAIGTGAASILAFLATRPVNFDFVGNDPEQWIEDISANIELHAAIAAQVAFYNEMLLANRKTMKRSARLLTAASFLALVTIAVTGWMAMPIIWPA
jgi:cell division septal protein FtsQ